MRRFRSLSPQISRKFRQFQTEQRGIVFIIVALVLVPLVTIAAGSAVDMSRWTMVEADLQNAADLTALETIRWRTANPENSREGAEEHGEGFLRNQILNMSPSYTDYSGSVDWYTQADGSERADVDVSIKIVSLFLHLVNIPDYSATAQSAATYNVPLLEVAIAIDISGSMDQQIGGNVNGSWVTQSKLAHMLDSMQIFITELFDTLGNSSGSQQDSLIVTLIPFAGSVGLPYRYLPYSVWPGRYLTNPQPAFFEAWGFADPTTANIVGAPVRFMGCFEYGLNSWWSVSNFDRLIPWNAMKVIDFRSFLTFYPHWCPSEQSIEVVPHQTGSANLLSMLAQIRNIGTRFDGTGLDSAFNWAYRMLSENWRGVLDVNFTPYSNLGSREIYPRTYDQDHQKVIILLTDGKVEIAQTGGYQGSRVVSGNNILGRTRWLNDCEHAKSREIRVFTVSYLSSDPQASVDLNTCASPNSSFLNTQVDQLSTSLESISSEYIKPRLIRRN